MMTMKVMKSMIILMMIVKKKMKLYLMRAETLLLVAEQG